VPDSLEGFEFAEEDITRMRKLWPAGEEAAAKVRMRSTYSFFSTHLGVRFWIGSSTPSPGHLVSALSIHYLSMQSLMPKGVVS
jgi:hypothetical protein